MLSNVRQRVLFFLSNRRTDLKRAWTKRLRAEPVRSALGDPAILGYLMDETLEQLSNLLTRRPVRGVKADEHAFGKRCRCGLNPLLDYYATGEQALMMVLETDYPADEIFRAFLGGQWRLLAQRELDALCGACIRTCARPFPDVASEAGAVTQSLRAGAGDLDTQSALLPRPGETRG